MGRTASRHPKKAGIFEGRSHDGFGQGCPPVRAALYARVSASHQQTIPVQLGQMCEFVARRGWRIAMMREEVQSGMKQRQEREAVMAAARRREIDVVVVWRLDRWGRSVVDLVGTLNELQELGVAFASLTEVFDLTTSTIDVIPRPGGPYFTTTSHWRSYPSLLVRTGSRTL
jgi:hypothetical protein